MILITGEGRSGTTLMLAVFSLLGFDTGGPSHTPAGPHEWLKHREITPDTQFPEVIKHLGGFVVNLKKWVTENNWQVDHLFYMANSLDVTINKRLYPGDQRGTIVSPRVNFQMKAAEYEKLNDTEKEELVRSTFERRVGITVYNAIDLGIPITIVHYQRFCRDPDYAVQMMQPIIGMKGLTEEDIRRVHGQHVILDKVKSWPKVVGYTGPNRSR